MGEIKAKSYRHSASFGKRMEHYLIGKMLKEGLDVFIPMIDDDAIDAVVKRPDGKFVEVQIKARSNEIKESYSAFFSAIKHKYRANYWFVFYSERMDKMWIMSSSEFCGESKVMSDGRRSIKFNRVANKAPKPLKKFENYIELNFDRIKNEDTK